MKKQYFSLSVLSLALASSLAFADDVKEKTNEDKHNHTHADEVKTSETNANTISQSQNKQATELETVTVKAQRISAKPIQDFREFEKSNATDLKDVLADEPSIQFGGGNGLAQHITLRGMGAD